jgi:hypothetical protein
MLCSASLQYPWGCTGVIYKHPNKRDGGLVPQFLDINTPAKMPGGVRGTVRQISSEFSRRLKLGGETAPQARSTETRKSTRPAGRGADLS